jgi:hypothetical protein
MKWLSEGGAVVVVVVVVVVAVVVAVVWGGVVALVLCHLYNSWVDRAMRWASRTEAEARMGKSVEGRLRVDRMSSVEEEKQSRRG